jgi:capsular polysaccharide biosynthesis protein
MEKPKNPTQPSAAMRKALGNLRRSRAVTHASDFLGVQRLRFRQRIAARFVRGVHLDTRTYLARQRGRDWGEYIPLPEFDVPTNIHAPTFVPSAPVAKIGGRLRVKSTKHGVALLNHPWVVGLSGAVIGQDNNLLWDLSYEWPGRPYNHTTYSLMKLDAEPLPGVTVTIAASGAADNYFHFLLNSAARLVYLEHAIGELKPDHVLVTGSITPRTLEALALFDVPAARIICTSEHPALRPERLIAPSLIHHPFIVPEHVCDFVRRRVLSKLGSPSVKRRRIMVDRGDAPARRIQNLSELSPLLEDHGVELVRLSGMSITRQAELFRDAELIIANHGAALANLVFCQPGTRVLQVIAPGMMEREYRTISQHGRLRHDYVVGQFASESDAHLVLKQRDLVIPFGILRQLLAEA